MDDPFVQAEAVNAIQTATDAVKLRFRYPSEAG